MKREEINVKKEVEAFFDKNPEFYGLFYEAINNEDVDMATDMTINMMMGLSSEAIAKMYLFFNKVSDKLDHFYYDDGMKSLEWFKFNAKISEISKMIDFMENKEDEG